MVAGLGIFHSYNSKIAGVTRIIDDLSSHKLGMQRPARNSVEMGCGLIKQMDVILRWMVKLSDFGQQSNSGKAPDLILASLYHICVGICGSNSISQPNRLTLQISRQNVD
jgi:hypothetical protein